MWSPASVRHARLATTWRRNALRVLVLARSFRGKCSPAFLSPGIDNSVRAARCSHTDFRLFYAARENGVETNISARRGDEQSRVARTRYEYLAVSFIADVSSERDHEVAARSRIESSPENMMAQAAPITPKNGEYIGAPSSELIVAESVGCRQRLDRSRDVYLQVARSSHGTSNAERSSRHSRR